MIDYINAYMRHWHLYEEEEEEQLLDGGAGKKEKKKNKKIVYRYDWLLVNNNAQKGDNDDHVQTLLQDRIIQFVIYKKKMGLGASGIDNYINPLQKFYWVNGIKGIIGSWSGHTDQSI